MQTRLKDWTLELPDGGFLLCAYAPTGPVLCAARNALMTVNPDAFALTPDQSEAIRRQPPNCEGLLMNWPTPEGPPADLPITRAPRANFPPFVADDRDDDEGDPAEPARYPPGVACNVTVECE